MGFGDILKKAKPKEETIELPDETEEPVEKIMVRVENLGGLEDAERIERLMQAGCILLLKVKELQSKDLGEFKNTVDKLKRRCLQYGWDMVAVSDGYIVMAPGFAKIVR